MAVWTSHGVGVSVDDTATNDGTDYIQQSTEPSVRRRRSIAGN